MLFQELFKHYLINMVDHHASLPIHAGNIPKVVVTILDEFLNLVQLVAIIHVNYVELESRMKTVNFRSLMR